MVEFLLFSDITAARGLGEHVSDDHLQEYVHQGHQEVWLLYIWWEFEVCQYQIFLEVEENMSVKTTFCWSFKSMFTRANKKRGCLTYEGNSKSVNIRDFLKLERICQLWLPSSVPSSRHSRFLIFISDFFICFSNSRFSSVLFFLTLDTTCQWWHLHQKMKVLDKWW